MHFLQFRTDIIVYTKGYRDYTAAGNNVSLSF